MTGWQALLAGLQTALGASALLAALCGLLLGGLAARWPGLGGVALAALLLPWLHGLGQVPALMLLMGLYCAGQAQQWTAQPTPPPAQPEPAETDAPPAVAAARPPAPRVRPWLRAVALAGGAALCLVWGVPWLLDRLAGFGPLDTAALLLLALACAVAGCRGSVLKAAAMVLCGALLAAVRIDLTTGLPSFGFSMPAWSQGISLLTLGAGLLGLGGILTQLAQTGAPPPLAAAASPGEGAARASAYPRAGLRPLLQHLNRHGPALLGLLVWLSAGVPFSPLLAMMGGVGAAPGLPPGPLGLAGQPGLFWGLVLAWCCCQLGLRALRRPWRVAAPWLQQPPVRWLWPGLMLLTLTGLFTVQHSVVDLYLALGLALLGHLLQQLRCPTTPLLMGFVLGPPLEQALRQVWTQLGGGAGELLLRPQAVVLLMAALLILLVAAVPGLQAWRVRVFGGA
jgi:putative tricarboxylic transport membrane protein